MRQNLVIALTAGAVGLALAACGGSSIKPTTTSANQSPASTSTPSSTTTAPSSTKASGTLTIAADPTGQLKFDKTAPTASAGKVTIQFTNNASLAHNLTLQQGTSGPVIGATPTFMGGTRTLTVSLKPGTYSFFCSVPGHREGGMQGTLTVK